MPRWPEGAVVPPRPTDSITPAPSIEDASEVQYEPVKLIRRRRGKDKPKPNGTLRNRAAGNKRAAAKIAAARRAVDRKNPDATLPLPDPDKGVPVRRPRDQSLRTFAPTPSQRVMVAALAACNVPLEGISAYVRVNDDTLAKYFRYELAEGYVRTEASLVGVLVVKALGGNMTALTMLLKCVFGWRENSKASDGPATIESLTTEQRVALIEGLRTSLNADEAGSGARGKNKARVVTLSGTTDGSDC